MHPAILAPVKYHGQEEVQIDPPEGDPYSVLADVWSWKFTVETDYAFTINGTDGNVELLQWTVQLGDNNHNSNSTNSINNNHDHYTAHLAPHPTRTPPPNQHPRHHHCKCNHHRG